MVLVHAPPPPPTCAMLGGAPLAHLEPLDGGLAARGQVVALSCVPHMGPYECTERGKEDPVPPGHTLCLRWRRDTEKEEEW